MHFSDTGYCLTETNYEEYLQIRRRDGPVAAFLFVEEQALENSPPPE